MSWQPMSEGISFNQKIPLREDNLVCGGARFSNWRA